MACMRFVCGAKALFVFIYFHPKASIPFCRHIPLLLCECVCTRYTPLQWTYRFLVVSVSHLLFGFVLRRARCVRVLPACFRFGTSNRAFRSHRRMNILLFWHCFLAAKSRCDCVTNYYYFVVYVSLYFFIGAPFTPSLCSSSPPPAFKWTRPTFFFAIYEQLYANKRAWLTTSWRRHGGGTAAARRWHSGGDIGAGYWAWAATEQHIAPRIYLCHT